LSDVVEVIDEGFWDFLCIGFDVIWDEVMVKLFLGVEFLFNQNLEE